MAFDGGAVAWRCERHTLGAVARAVQLLDGFLWKKKVVEVGLEWGY